LEASLVVACLADAVVVLTFDAEIQVASFQVAGGHQGGALQA